MTGGTLGRGRHLAEPQFPDDDGAADVQVRAVLEATARGDLPVEAAARALRGARLLATVSAVLDAVDETGGDKDSHMAVVSMVSERGEKGLLAFTGMDALAAWSTEGRPVPAYGRDLGRAAVDDGADAVVVDVAGPARVVLAGRALAVLVDDLDVPKVAALVHAAVAPLTADGWVDVEVVDGRVDGQAVDVIVLVSAAGGGHPDGRLLPDLARQAATILQARADIQSLVPGGIGVAVA